jgi:hypothetical protein
MRQKEVKKVNQESEKFSLLIETQPENTKIYITNIRPRYRDNIRLKEGRYDLKMIASGYKTLKKSVYLDRDTRLYYVLEKIEKKSFVSQDKKGFWRDEKSGLMWQDDRQKTSVINWSGAMALQYESAEKYCQELNLGSFSDWRLPTLKELFGIVDYTRYEPAVNENIKNVAAGFYWSSSLVVADSGGFISNLFGYTDEKVEPTEAWVIYFLDGSIETATFTTDGHVRCVRGVRE